MDAVMLPLRESQVVDLARQLSPAGKRAILRALIPDPNQFEVLVDYGNERVRALCKERGISWDGLSEEERERLIDDLLHKDT